MRNFTCVAVALVLAVSAPGIEAQTPAPATDPAAAVEHYRMVERARAAYGGGRFAEAETLFERATATAPDDASLWYLLARSRHRQGDADGAIAAYRETADRGYRYGAWVPYQVARLHGEAGRADSALAWLERALAAGWDERPGLAGDEAFAALADDPRFRELAATDADPAAARDDKWRRDIDHYVAEAQRLHAGPARPAHGEAFLRAADSLKGRVPDLSNDRLALGMNHLATFLGDGHSGIYGVIGPTSLEYRDSSLPLLFYEFADGLHVVDATDDHRDWIGARVVAFGNVPATDAVDALSTFMHHDNAMTVTWLGIRFMLPTLRFLEGIGAAGSHSSATLTLRRPGESAVDVRFEGGNHVRQFRRKLRPPPGADSVPLYLSRVDTEYWLEPLPERDALYFQFNQVRDMDGGPSIAAFADTLRASLERSGAAHLIIDVRHNNGGNNGLLRPLLRTLTWWELDDPSHIIYAITSRNTFSAAQNFINRLESLTDAVFVGEPSSSRPNFTGEETMVLLPRTGIGGSISNRHWQDSSPDDARSFIPPDVPVGLSSDQYFSGRDPALEAVFLLIEGGR